MDNKQLAHVWAQGEKLSGYTSNKNMSFSGNLIYSYRTAIAQRVQNKKGETAYLVNSNKYSVTTSGKHMPAVYGALRGLSEPVFTVPDVYSAGSDNVEHYKRQYEKLLFDASRARNHADSITSQAARLANEMTAYCAFFGILIPTLPAINPETLARCKARLKEESAKKKQEAADILKRWLAGENVTVRNAHTGDTYLRVSGEEIETSRGARFPIEHAVKVFRHIERCKDDVTGWIANGHTIHLGHFRIDRIEPNGDVKAGCHYVKYSEIERVAKQLNLI